MSREIKFRAWDKDSKRYGEVVEIEYNESREIDGIWVWYNIHERYEPIPGANVTVEQYTGLKDKNGKEIYEGDIIWWEHFYGMTGENIETTAKVYWEEKDASFVVGDWFEPLGHLVDEDEVEVIGNIHENPELLEDK